jgi:beta-lactamase family protein
VSFEALEAAIPGAVGLALAAVGSAPEIEELGALRGGVAWSTIKVPIALAVEARSEGRSTDRERELIADALTVSDNRAAEELWASLGAPADAASAVESLLALAGDTSTRVETRILRPGFTPFGQTQWSLAAQVRLMAALPGLPHSEPVRQHMRRVAPEQRWGLGALAEDAELKGGWGPDPDGRSLVRQMGIVSIAGRPLAVAIATMPADGTEASGTENLDRLAEWLGGTELVRGHE